MKKIEDYESCSKKPTFQLFNSSGATVFKKRKRARAPLGKPPYSYVALNYHGNKKFTRSQDDLGRDTEVHPRKLSLLQKMSFKVARFNQTQPHAH